MLNKALIFAAVFTTATAQATPITPVSFFDTFHQAQQVVQSGATTVTSNQAWSNSDFGFTNRIIETTNIDGSNPNGTNFLDINGGLLSIFNITPTHNLATVEYYDAGGSFLTDYIFELDALASSNATFRITLEDITGTSQTLSYLLENGLTHIILDISSDFNLVNSGEIERLILTHERTGPYTGGADTTYITNWEYLCGNSATNCQPGDDDPSAVSTPGTLASMGIGLAALKMATKKGADAARKAPGTFRQKAAVMATILFGSLLAPQASAKTDLIIPQDRALNKGGMDGSKVMDDRALNSGGSALGSFDPSDAL